MSGYAVILDDLRHHAGHLRSGRRGAAKFLRPVGYRADKIMMNHVRLGVGVAGRVALGRRTASSQHRAAAAEHFNLVRLGKVARTNSDQIRRICRKPKAVGCSLVLQKAIANLIKELQVIAAAGTLLAPYAHGIYAPGRTAGRVEASSGVGNEFLRGIAGVAALLKVGDG